MAKMHTELLAEVEALVDNSRLYDVLSAVQDMCLEKADHIRSNWQDNTSADCWSRAAKGIGMAMARCEV